MRFTEYLFETNNELLNEVKQASTNLVSLPINQKGGPGFSVRDDTQIIRPSGRYVDAPAGTTVYITRPGTQYKAKELDITGNGVYVMVGFKSSTKADAVGYLMLTNIGNPNNEQTRVSAGAEAQDVVRAKMEEKFGNQFQFISSAKKSSQEPDLIGKLGRQPVQFEVKGRKLAEATITIFDKSLRRGAEAHPMLDELAGVFTANAYATFESMIDGYRERELKLGFPKEKKPVVGFPGDEHTPKSGKIPPQFRVHDNPALFQRVRDFLLDHLHLNGDNYFALVDRERGRDVEIFWTGGGTNPLKAPAFPMLSFVVLDTYGEPYKGAMRIALKVSFDPSHRGLVI